MNSALPPESGAILRRILPGIVFGCLVGVIFYQQLELRRLRDEKSVRLASSSIRPSASPGPAEEPSSDGRAAARSHRPDGTRHDLAKESRQQELQGRLDEITKPLEQDIASSMFNAKVSETQSVVTGGFPTADGRSQFTFLTPNRIAMADGSEAIRIDARTVAVNPDATRDNGLGSLATNARNTLQHAETWEDQDLKVTLDQLAQTHGADLLAMPRVIIKPGQDFSIMISSGEYGSHYSISGSADFAATGAGFIIKARIEQKDSTAPGE